MASFSCALTDDSSADSLSSRSLALRRMLCTYDITREHERTSDNAKDTSWLKTPKKSEDPLSLRKARR